ncbi:MAG TPA: lysozyme inhibitor LprI family protein [Burkholderiaceae bacterium]
MRLRPRLLLTAAALACASLSSTAATAPAALQGRWVVRQVAVDANDTIRRSNEPDDPRLMGGILDILADGSIDPARQDCAKATWQARGTTTLAALVGRNVRESSGKRTHPSLADYGLSVGNPKLQVHTALCAAPSPGARREPYDGGNWFAALSPDRMIEGNGVDTVLVYQRLTDHSPVEPSFACTGTLAEAQQAICRSQSLAALDRSVALALARARKRNDDGAAGLQALEREQAAWLAERDRCKASEPCLAEHMNDRIQELMQR